MSACSLLVVPTRLVVLVSGAGTNLQALLDACADPAYGAQVVAVGADRDGIEGLARADRAGVPTFVRRVGDYHDRAEWDLRSDRAVGVLRARRSSCSAGFLKLVGPRVPGALRRPVRQHATTRCCRSFPGITARATPWPTA